MALNALGAAWMNQQRPQSVTQAPDGRTVLGTWQDPATQAGHDFNTYVDDRGRPYNYIGGKAGGQKVYTSPASYNGRGDLGADVGGGNFFKEAPSWDQNAGETKRDWNWQNIGSLAVGGIAGVAAAPAIAGAFGGAAAPTGTAAAATGALPASIPAAALTPGMAAATVGGAAVPVGTGGAIAGASGLATIGKYLVPAAQTLGNVAGTIVQANAAKDAAKTQAEAAKAAAAYQEGQTNRALDYIGGIRGQIPTGNASPAYARLSQGMGLVRPNQAPPQAGMASGVAPMNNPFASRYAAAQPSPAGVRMQSPTGEVATITPDQVQNYIARGAKVVQ